MRRWAIRLFLILIFVLLILPFLLPLPVVGEDPSVFFDPDGRMITVNGLQTYVRQSGDPDGEPVLLLHGWGGSTFSWRETIPALAEAGYSVIAFDRPPYGLSDKTGVLPLSLTRQAEFTAAVMDALEIERATLIGHSMGGGVIAYFAHLYPERVEKLVFVDGAVRVAGADENRGGGTSPVVRALVNFHPVEWWARVGMRAFVRPDAFAGMQRTAYYDQSVVTDEVIAGYGRQLQVRGWDAAILDVLMRDFSEDVPLTPEEVEAITNPALIIWGANDTWVPPSAGESLRALLPNQTYISYDQVGHMPMEEVPEQFNQDVLEFLAG